MDSSIKIRRRQVEALLIDVLTGLGYTPEDVANKVATIAGVSDEDYPTEKAVADYVQSLLVQTILSGDTTHFPSSDAVFDALATKATPADITAAITVVKDGVGTAGDTLQKLYNLILAGNNEVYVANHAAMTAYNVPSLPFSFFVTDDGGGKWAKYQATSTGVGATVVKISDQDSASATMNAAAIKVAYESNSNTNAFTNALLTKLNTLILLVAGVDYVAPLSSVLVKYTSDFSSSYDDRSLVDKGYVDSHITSQTFWVKVGNNIYSNNSAGFTSIGNGTNRVEIGDIGSQTVLRHVMAGTVVTFQIVNTGGENYRIGSTTVYFEVKTGSPNRLAVSHPVESPEPTASNHLATKNYADSLITTIKGGVTSAGDTLLKLYNLIAGKQNTLTAGAGISIVGDTISADIPDPTPGQVIITSGGSVTNITNAWNNCIIIVKAAGCYIQIPDGLDPSLNFVIKVANSGNCQVVATGSISKTIETIDNVGSYIQSGKMATFIREGSTQTYYLTGDTAASFF